MKTEYESRKLVYISHPMMSDDEGQSWNDNIKNIRRICDYMMDDIETVNNDFVIRGSSSDGFEVVNNELSPYFIAVQLYIPQFINESNASEADFEKMRKIAINMCMKFVEVSDEVHVYTPDGKISSGMKDDIEVASKLGIPVIFKDNYPWEDENE